MSRLPVQGGDNGNWGNILNDFLVQSHNTNGTLRDNTVDAAQIKDSAVSANKLSAPVNSYLASAQTAVQTVNGKSGNTISIALDDVSDVNLASAADGQALVKTEPAGRRRQWPVRVILQVRLIALHYGQVLKTPNITQRAMGQPMIRSRFKRP